MSTVPLLKPSIKVSRDIFARKTLAETATNERQQQRTEDRADPGQMEPWGTY